MCMLRIISWNGPYTLRKLGKAQIGGYGANLNYLSFGLGLVLPNYQGKLWI